MPAEWELTEEFPDEEIFLVEVLPPLEKYFDGAARRNGVGAGVMFVSPRRDLLPYSFVLTQNCSNNEAEYQAILLGLGTTVEMKLPQLNIYDNSALVIKQLRGEFEVKKLELVPFWRHAGELLAQIPEASLHYVPRSENGPADVLAGIAASLAQFDERPTQVPIYERWVVPPPVEEEVEEERTEEIEESLPISARKNTTGDWREPITNFLRHGIFPVDLRERVQIRRAAPKEGLTTEECAQLRLAELESLDEQRLEAQQRLECYQSYMTSCSQSDGQCSLRAKPGASSNQSGKDRM
ncbi:hypothetical protein H6P81_006053 [Aristolochia fimbriata]|uniref:RNase H type-1 domain-containing protein n=1 Tax=Aristolochia fimbriata TaxID=158543 RepID=A0AAV7EXB3_ARIFI|nr:hypothetical protein H6P81_006053 [Aristolochia fimbriata]